MSIHNTCQNKMVGEFILHKDRFSHKPSVRFVNAAKLSFVLIKKINKSVFVCVCFVLQPFSNNFIIPLSLNLSL